MYFRTILILLLVVLAKHYTIGQDASLGLPFIKNYKKTDYQAGPQNWSILQDNRGIMFFGNSHGLLEFDGTNWSRHALPNKTIPRSLATDKNGRIYVGGQGDFGYFFPDSLGHLTFHSLLSKVPPIHRNFADVWRIHITEDGIFFNTFRAIFQLKNGNINVWAPTEGFNLTFIVDDDIYVIDWGKGLLKYDQSGFFLIPGGEKFARNGIAAILPYKNQKLLILTYLNKVFEYDNGKLKEWRTPAAEFFKVNNAYCGIELDNEMYAIGTSNNGIFLLSQDGNQIQHLTEGKGLSSRSVLGLYKDQTGNLWAGLNNGIAFIETESSFVVIDEKVGVPGAGYASGIKDSLLYLGTNIGVFYTDLRDSNQGLFKPVSGSAGQTWTINKIDSNLILGQHEGAFVLEGDKVRKFSSTIGSWNFLKLKGHPNMMLGGNYKGLQLFKNISPSNKPNWIPHAVVEGFSESARIIEQGADGSLWIAHGYKGLFNLKLNKDLNTAMDVNLYNSQNGLPSDIFNDLFKIDSKIVFSGETGIYQHNDSSRRFEVHPQWNDLLDKNKRTSNLIADKQENIWYVSDKEVGLLKIQKDGSYLSEKKMFGKLQDKLIGGFEYIEPLQNGNVLFGTDEGFILYDSKNQKDSLDSFKTLIRQVTVGHQDSAIYNGYHIVDDKISTIQPAEKVRTVPYKLNELNFAFSAVFYEGTDKTLYKYFLQGFDEDWSEWNGKVEKEYTNIPEGDYTFRVKAKNIYDVESQEAVYSFIVLPPWFRSVYAYTFYGTLGLLFVAGIVLVTGRKHKLEKKSLIQKQQTTLKEKEYEYAEKSKQTEAEIIRLKNEKLETEVIHKNKELATSTMHIIHNNEFLTKLKSRLEGAAKKVNDEAPKKELCDLIKHINDDIVHDVDWKQFEIHFDQTHENYLKRLREKHPQLTPKDIKLCSYLRMNLATKEIAPLLNISYRGVEIARYRLRKKLKINGKADLVEFIMEV